MSSTARTSNGSFATGTYLLSCLREHPLVYPAAMILALGAIALVPIIYKVIFLNRVHGNTDRIMNEVSAFASRGDWAACEGIVRKYKDKKMPVRDALARAL